MSSKNLKKAMESYSLDEICSYSKTRISIDEITNRNYISTENMVVNRGGITEASTLPNTKNVVKYDKGNTLISNIRPYFKKIWYANKEGGASNDVLVFKGDSQKVLDKYLYYFLSQDKFFDYIMRTSKGTKMPRGDKDAILKYNITLPPLEEQKEIAKVLSDLDEKIEINNKINKTLEEMAQAIFKQWFVDFEFPNEEGKPYKSSGGEMVESELGMIPKGWSIKGLGDLCDIQTKSEKPFENLDVLYEHFSLPACDNGKLPVIELGKYISSNKYKVDNDCILISKLNPATKRIWNPLCKTENSICSTEFIVYKPKNKNIKSFCYELINSGRFTDFLLANVTGSTGSRQRAIPKSTLNYKIAISNEEIINKICMILEPIHKKVLINIDENLKLGNIRDTLLPKLMSGEIRVPLSSIKN